MYSFVPDDKTQIAQLLLSEEALGCTCELICDISGMELSRKDSISGGQGLESEAGQGDLKGVLSQVLRMSMAVCGGVDMPETERTLELLMERAFCASEGEVHVAA